MSENFKADNEVTPNVVSFPGANGIKVEEVPTIEGKAVSVDEALEEADGIVRDWETYVAANPAVVVENGEAKEKASIVLNEGTQYTVTRESLAEVAKHGLPQEVYDHAVGKEVPEAERAEVAAVGNELAVGGRTIEQIIADGPAFADVPPEVLAQEQQARDIVAATEGEEPGFFERHPKARKAALSLFSVMGLAGLLGKSDDASARGNYVEDVLKVQRSGGREQILQGVISVIAGAAANRVAREIDPQGVPVGQPGVYQGQPGYYPGQPGGVYAPGGYEMGGQHAEMQRLQYERNRLITLINDNVRDLQRISNECRMAPDYRTQQNCISVLRNVESQMHQHRHELMQVDQQIARLYGVR